MWSLAVLRIMTPEAWQALYSQLLWLLEAPPACGGRSMASLAAGTVPFGDHGHQPASGGAGYGLFVRLLWQRCRFAAGGCVRVEMPGLIV